jgi:hypothetical protein
MLTFRCFLEASKSGILWFFPQLADLFPRFFGWERLVEVSRPFFQFFQNIVDEHQASELKDVGSERPTDFCYAYLNEISRTTDPSSSFYQDKGRKIVNMRPGSMYMCIARRNYEYWDHV